MPKKSKRPPKRSTGNSPTRAGRGSAKTNAESTLRIVGGSFRGRRLQYAGDPRVRPMKDRIREALFNLLGPAIKGTHAIDLFGGTGALALEALSRGSVSAHIVERHLPTARVIRQNVEDFAVQDRVELVRTSCFHWLSKQPELPEIPWVVFVSPPYSFFVQQRDELVQLVQTLLDQAPAGSLFAVEGTREFDFSVLPRPEIWDVRSYPPAEVGVAKLPLGGEENEAI